MGSDAEMAGELTKMLRGPGGDPDDGYRLVTWTMRRTLARLFTQRSLPVLG